MVQISFHSMHPNKQTRTVTDTVIIRPEPTEIRVQGCLVLLPLTEQDVLIPMETVFPMLMQVGQWHKAPTHSQAMRPNQRTLTATVTAMTRPEPIQTTAPISTEIQQTTERDAQTRTVMEFRMQTDCGTFLKVGMLSVPIRRNGKTKTVMDTAITQAETSPMPAQQNTAILGRTAP
tara:strand:- start:12 stop:539 length:528 start_codon:yes stop_codon:yes gene_type:complete